MAGAVCKALARRAVPATALQALAAVALMAALQWLLAHGAGFAAVFCGGAARFASAVAERAHRRRRRSAEGDAPRKGVRC